MKDEREEELGKMELLVSAFSNSQQDQYEIFRRSTFPKSSVRKLMQSVCGSSVPQNAVIAMAGIAKVHTHMYAHTHACANTHRHTPTRTHRHTHTYTVLYKCLRVLQEPGKLLYMYTLLPQIVTMS